MKLRNLQVNAAIQIISKLWRDVAKSFVAYLTTLRRFSFVSLIFSDILHEAAGKAVMVLFLPGTLFLAIELSVLLLPPYCFGHLFGTGDYLFGDITIIVVEVVADRDRGQAG